MSIEVWWTPERKAEFIRLGNLKGADALIIGMRDERSCCENDLDKLSAHGYYMSSSTYYHRVRALKALYDAVQPWAEKCPPRQHSKAQARKYAAWTRSTSHLFK